jgi:hypothetical protein
MTRESNTCEPSIPSDVVQLKLSRGEFLKIRRCRLRPSDKARAGIEFA